jgi:hypothetical protein
VPDTARKRVLEVQSHPSEIRIFKEGQLIAQHPVLKGRNLRRVEVVIAKPLRPLADRGLYSRAAGDGLGTMLDSDLWLSMTLSRSAWLRRRVRR